MAKRTLEQNIRQAISDFDGIKAAIEDKGVSVPNGTDTSEYGDKVGEVYDKGSTDTVARFWEMTSKGGTRKEWLYLFAHSKLKSEFFKYPITIKGTNMYCLMYLSDAGDLIDLVDMEQNYGFKIDFSNATNVANAFQQAYVTRIGVVDLSKANNAYLTFACNMWSDKCTSIQKIITHEKLDFSNAFNYRSALTHVIFEGVIGKNGLNLSQSPNLDHESLLSIVNCLKDYSADTSGTTWKVTLGDTNLARLTADEKSMMANKGWTYV